MEFPTLVFRCPGEHFAHDGATYKYAAAEDQEAFDARIADGWHESLVKAVDAFKNPSPVSTVNESSVPSDDEAPTRVELETKATELAIKFDGRTSDAKLLKMINERL